MLVMTDLSSDGYGQPWGHTRSYSNRLSANTNNEGVNGANWFIKQCPYLINLNPSQSDPNKATIVLLGVVSEAVWFDYDSTSDTYVARFFNPDTLVHNGDEFIFSNQAGRKIKFNDFTVATAELQGKFKGIVAPSGDETVAIYGTNNQIASFTQGAGSSSSSSSGGGGSSSGGGEASMGYEYDYYSDGDNAGRLMYVTQSRGGSSLRRAYNTYYGSGDVYGGLGDLQLVTLQQFNGLSWEDLGSTYHRFYQTGDSNGFAHGLKYIVSAATYARMLADGLIPEAASDSVLSMYADVYFEYDSNQRVSLVAVAGLYSIYTYDYTESANSDGYNNWKMKTVETLPDGSKNIVYTNYAGQVILKIFQSGTSQWYEYYKYDDQGRTILFAESSAVDSYSESAPGLVTLKSNSGLVHIYEFYTTTGSGEVAGYLANEQLQQGGSGSPVLLREWQYTTQSDGSSSVNPLWKEIVYQSDTSGGSDAATTEYTYQWYGTSLQMKQRTATLPVISASQNGDGNTYARDAVYDIYGRVTWQRDELGFLTYTKYDDASGAVLQVIQDVDTSEVSGAPSGWTTPTGGGLNLITDYTIDSLGRVTQALGPVHNVDLGGLNTPIRRASWSVYLDTQNQQRQGRGYWNQDDDSYTLINPVQITVTDGLGRLTDEISATRDSSSGPLTSADEFPQSNWVRWQKRNYGVMGLLLSQQVYFAIPTSGIGVNGVNYNSTYYGYDVMRKQVRVESAGGTVTRYVYSSLGEILETWVGTNDTGATNSDPSGGGASGNNMKQIDENVYDNGADKGDRNLTRVTRYVNDSISRVTEYGYDWRNRQVNTAGEIGFYQSQIYDNQNRVLQVNRYDTDSSGNLIARSETKYDDLGRVYQTITYGVDPDTGTVGNALTSNTWYDPVGNVLKQQSAGSNAFTKSFYDGVRRLTMQYVAYAVTTPVAGDIVMQQSETTYDAASNVIEQLVRERFHNAPATAVGELTDPNGDDPKARVSYMASWPDPIGRQVASANYGTNGGSALSRPDTIPAASDTVLLSTTEFNDRGEAELVTDPAGMVTKSVFDDAGRLTSKIEDYSASSGHLNRETDYTYNADGKLKILTAKNSVTGDQVTTYYYGTTLTDSNLASNDLLASVAYPDSTGASDRVKMTYNRQGQVTSKTDQLGSVHTMEYDLLGRLIHDRVTTLGAGVDNAILRISTTYEVRGLVQNVTSFDNATVGSGSVVNDVQNEYNDFSQLVTQYQSHSGAVNTSSTPAVQYEYADGSANTIRPTLTTYPDGRELTISYGTSGAMNDQLSRVESLIDDDGTTYLADYTYLGLSKIVQVSSPEVS